MVIATLAAACSYAMPASVEMEKDVAKEPSRGAAKICSVPDQPAGEYRDDDFGNLDANSAEVLLRLKSAKIPRISFGADGKPGMIAQWILEQVPLLDGGKAIDYTIRCNSFGGLVRGGVAEKIESPLYVSNITCWEALKMLFEACGCPWAQVFIDGGRVHVYFRGCALNCRYEVVNDEAAESVFREIEEDGLPKGLNIFEGRVKCRKRLGSGSTRILELEAAPHYIWRFMEELDMAGVEYTLVERRRGLESKLCWKRFTRDDQGKLKVQDLDAAVSERLRRKRPDVKKENNARTDAKAESGEGGE